MITMMMTKALQHTPIRRKTLMIAAWSAGRKDAAVDRYTVKKTGPRGVRFEGCYSPRSVMATH